MADWRDFVDGGVGLALLTAGLSALGWLIIKVFDWVSARADRKNRRREALASFFVDVKIRQDVVRKVFSEKNLEVCLKLVEEDGDDLRPFVVSFEARSVENLLREVQPFLGSLPERELAAASFYISYAGLLETYYGRLGSDEFVGLSPRRKQNALRNCFDIAKEAGICCSEVIDAMTSGERFKKSRRSGFMTTLDEESNRIISKLREAQE